MNNDLNNVRFPFMIEKNLGQHNNEAKYVLKKSNGIVFFLESEVIFALISSKDFDETEELTKEKYVKNCKIPLKYEANLFSMKLERGNNAPELVAEGEFDCKINYIRGKDASKSIINIPIYETLTYKDVYPGIDLIYYENQGFLEHDFIISPYVDVNQINMLFTGVDKLEKDESGNVVISVKQHTVQMLKPKAYQIIEDKKVEIVSHFKIEGESVKFDIQNYDKSKILVIDPPLLYGTYLGGTSFDFATSVAVDTNENAYLTGETFSSEEFPLKNAYNAIYNGTRESYLIKIDTKESGLSSLKYGSYLGGNSSDYGQGVAVDVNENAYITGYTRSTSDFPLKNAYQEEKKGDYDAYLIKIDTKLSGTASLKYGTYLGGNGRDRGYSVAIDSDENAYITGETLSTTDFPIKNAYQETKKGNVDAFLIKIDTKLSGVNSLKYGTYLGGTREGGAYSSTNGRGVSLDSNENAYITGLTSASENFPTRNGYQVTSNDGGEAFLIRLDTKLSGDDGLVYGTYLGGNNLDFGRGVAVDVNENAYITGYTESTTDFPLKNAYQDGLKGNQDAFLIKLDTKLSGLSSLKYGTYLGGSGTDYGYSVAVDVNENAYIAGDTNSSTEFPLKDPYQDSLKGDYDAYLSVIDTTLIGELSLKYGTYLGGNEDDGGLGLALDLRRNVYIVGYTYSNEDFPLKNEYSDTLKGFYDGFLIKMNVNEPVCELVLEKSTCVCKAYIGDTIPYTFKVTNNGPDIVTNIVVKDVFDADVKINTYKALRGTISKCYNTIEWKIPKLEVGETTIAMVVVTPCKIIRSCSYREGRIIQNTANLTCDNTLLDTSVTTSSTLTYVEYKYWH